MHRIFHFCSHWEKHIPLSCTWIQNWILQYYLCLLQLIQWHTSSGPDGASLGQDWIFSNKFSTLAIWLCNHFQRLNFFKCGTSTVSLYSASLSPTLSGSYVTTQTWNERAGVSNGFKPHIRRMLYTCPKKTPISEKIFTHPVVELIWKNV